MCVLNYYGQCTQRTFVVIVIQGVNICQMFDLSAKDLFYKWEALNYNNSNTQSFSDFTLHSVDALKAQIQRNLSNGGHSRDRGRKLGATFARTNLGVNNTGDTQAKLDNRTGQPKYESGRSKISFKGPKNDAVTRRHRACEL